jgi:hypothetical protein
MGLNMSPVVGNSEAAILSRTIRPEEGDLSADAAKSLLNLSIPDADQRRAQELSAKATHDGLSRPEEVELDNYRSVGRLLELMKSKARLSPQKSQAA